MGQMLTEKGMVAEMHKDANLILKFLQCLSRDVSE